MLDITGKTQTHTHSLSLSLSLLLGKSQSLVDSSLTHLSLDSFHLCSFYDMSLAFISSSLCVDVSTWVWLSLGFKNKEHLVYRDMSRGDEIDPLQSVLPILESQNCNQYLYSWQDGNLSFIIIIFFKEDEWFNWRFHAYTMVNLPPCLCCVVDVYATRNICHLDILSAQWLEIIEWLTL